MSAPYYSDDSVTLHHGDCLQVMAAMPDASVDAVVTDPPYGLEFMGKGWDGSDGFRRSLNPADADRDSPFGRTSRTSPEYRAGALFQEWSEAWARECLRVLKPGGHMLAFGGSRTWHRLACAVEDAGFEIRDSIAWLYGSGFPKSLDVSKAIDKAAGAEREKVPATGGLHANRLLNDDGWSKIGAAAPDMDGPNPATPDAERWQGWGTALKPSHEPVVVARKPHVIGGILAGIGSELTRLEDECRPSANGAARSSAPTPAASPEARTATAPASAATPHEDGQEPTTPTGAAGATSDRTATSWSDETTAPTPWSIVSSWRACWAELCELTSTSTTSTTTEATTDLRTLWSSISSLTVTSTPGSLTPALTSPSIASAVDSLFAATVLRLRATLALSATESATASTPHVPQAAGGSSAFEPVVVARKPLAGTVAANVLQHGTGALNIDGCRVGDRGEQSYTVTRWKPGATLNREGGTWKRDDPDAPTVSGTLPSGRWPANVLLDDTQAAELDRQSGERKAGGNLNGTEPSRPTKDAYGEYNERREWESYGDTGGASRFFPTFRYEAKAPTSERPRVDGIAHPTVKPLDLMRWLVRLVTPPNGTVLEPFAGSGTTAEACILEGFQCIAIEREADYLPLIVSRLSKPMQLGLDFGEVAS